MSSHRGYSEERVFSKAHPEAGDRIRVATTICEDGFCRTSESEGTYLGIRPSEWTGEPMHWFENGHINGVPQRVFAFPVAQGGDDKPALITKTSSRGEAHQFGRGAYRATCGISTELMAERRRAIVSHCPRCFPTGEGDDSPAGAGHAVEADRG